MAIMIEALNKNHDREAFDCGVPELNRFLRQQARQKTEKNIAKTYVACHSSRPENIVGYYTLCGYSIVPPLSYKDYKNYPHPLSGVKLARLAVSTLQQGRGLGALLLMDSIQKTVMVSQKISAIGLFVDPMTRDVIPFYKNYGFLPVGSADSDVFEIWLPIKCCIDLVSKNVKN